VQRYRASKDYADDVGAMVTFLPGQGATRVVAIGTSAGTLSVANAMSCLSASRRAGAHLGLPECRRIGASPSGSCAAGIREFSGGRAAESDVCRAYSQHGFFGLDEEVVETGQVDKAASLTLFWHCSVTRLPV
jgi:hypothetical protein